MDSITALLTYKLTCVVAGVFIVWMGYRLFTLGIFRSSGDVDVLFDKKAKILIKRGAPGTFFTLFGSLFLVVTVWKGLEVESAKPSAKATASGTELEKATTVARGFGDGDRSKDLSIAQAMNTVTEAISSDLDTEAFKRAAQMLREERTAIARRYLPKETLDVYWNSESKQTSEMTDAERAAVKTCKEWMVSKLE